MAEPSLLGEWAIDPWHSSVAFTCRVNAMSSLDGRFDAFQGAVVFAPDGAHHAHGAVQTASIDTNLPQRDEVLRRPATFDAETHPEMRFAASEIVRGEHDALRVAGELTIRDVTLPVQLTGTLEGPLVDALGTERVGLELSGEVSCGAFGIGGLPVVADRIELRLGLQAVRAEAA